MKLLIITFLSITAVLLGTLTSQSFWQVVRRNRCKHCEGEGFVEHVGEGLYEKCEHCNLAKLKTLKQKKI